MGQSPSGSTYNKIFEVTPFYQGVKDFGTFFPTKRIFCIKPKRFAKNNDILFSVRAPIGSINIANEKCAIGRGLAALRLKNEQGPFLYYLLKNFSEEWDKFEAEGTVFGAMTKDDLHDLKIITPPNELIKKFNSCTNVLFKTIKKNAEYITRLIYLKQLLLPKLMSGEIRV